MKISLDWVGDYADLPAYLSAADIARELTLKTVEVEGRIDTAASLDNVVVGRVVELRTHGNSAVIATCECGEERRVVVVTRARNLVSGSHVAIALPGAVVNDRAIQPTVVDGVESEAYLCRAADLGLEKLFPPRGSMDALLLDDLGSEPGAPLVGQIPWSDTVLEIDNKSLTNRPDLWGHYGIARELAAIFRVPLRPLLPQPTSPRPPQRTDLIGTVEPDLCRRLALVQFELAAHTASPVWLRARLARLGESSVSLAVDLANYVMFATGQPLHVYDADRVSLPLSVGSTSGVAELELLDGSTATVCSGSTLVSDANGPVALAGIMGGRRSAVSAGTRRFLLEAASFQARDIRRTAQSLGMRTEAATRFEKGLDTQRVDQAIDLYLALLSMIAPEARPTGYQDHDPSPTHGAHITVPIEFLNSRIGLRLEAKEIADTLTALGFEATVGATTVEATAPSWRSTGDVSIPDDVLEEIARIHGYDAIPAATVSGTFTHLSPVQILPIDRRVRQQLAARADMQEVVTYPWCADHMLRAAGLDAADGVAFEGAPAPDRASLRPSLIPNLLEAVAQNLRYADDFDIFEVGTVFAGGEHAPFAGRFEAMPKQGKHAAAMLVGSDGPNLFLRAKGVLEMLRRHAHIVDLSLEETVHDGPAWADRQVRLDLMANGRRVGVLGLLSTRCKRLSGLEEVQVAAFELDLEQLELQPTRDNSYRPVSELPESDFDLSVVVPIETTWAQLEASARSAGGLVEQVAYVGDFRGGWVPEGRKSTTLRVTLRPQSTTLTAEDIAAGREAVLEVLARDIGAHLRA